MVTPSSLVGAASSFASSSHTHFLGPASPSPSVRSRPQRVTISAVHTSADRSCRLSTSDLSPMSLSLYDVLGLPTGATCQEIKAAYRRLARSCHPDVVAMDRKDTSSAEFKKIHAAYSTLSDPEKRADYDRSLLRGWPQPLRSSSISATRAPSFTGRRTWETDQCW